MICIVNHSVEVDLLSLLFDEFAINNSLGSCCVCDDVLVTARIVHHLLRLLLH